jgi:hypothetical protein
MGRGMICAEYLMEPDWVEGFTCSLLSGHDGPHRAEGGINDVNESVDSGGRKYVWTFEWRYQE